MDLNNFVEYENTKTYFNRSSSNQDAVSIKKIFQFVFKRGFLEKNFTDTPQYVNLFFDAASNKIAFVFDVKNQNSLMLRYLTNSKHLYVINTGFFKTNKIDVKQLMGDYSYAVEEKNGKKFFIVDLNKKLDD